MTTHAASPPGHGGQVYVVAVPTNGQTQSVGRAGQAEAANSSIDGNISTYYTPAPNANSYGRTVYADQGPSSYVTLSGGSYVDSPNGSIAIAQATPLARAHSATVIRVPPSNATVNGYSSTGPAIHSGVSYISSPPQYAIIQHPQMTCIRYEVPAATDGDPLHRPSTQHVQYTLAAPSMLESAAPTPATIVYATSESNLSNWQYQYQHPSTTATPATVSPIYATSVEDDRTVYTTSYASESLPTFVPAAPQPETYATASGQTYRVYTIPARIDPTETHIHTQPLLDADGNPSASVYILPSPPSTTYGDSSAALVQSPPTTHYHPQPKAETDQHEDDYQTFEPERRLTTSSKPGDGKAPTHWRSDSGRNQGESSSLEIATDVYGMQASAVCDLCNQKFRRSADLRRHLRIHSGVRPYLCPNCGETFSRADHLHRHRAKKKPCRATASGTADGH
ncbi:hypothetical protein M427DRAFT_70782 [Gonapodya prolifera JEL478]|uniref:C2H2-type domain-containing protein n=1 Tax=Gonapodya prolifera (strain JEL478) TaxID=1344416 RepID=A0A139AB62_GONPJ|nr:hypothetical protein M427DRAFT_70782 [Gonapodya prolifera JEL478]|eukprot:KXS14062.1 hypothetical protein M427DRAFT_70782 [Gonapodya prolifera JEL478]